MTYYPGDLVKKVRELELNPEPINGRVGIITEVFSKYLLVHFVGEPDPILCLYPELRKVRLKGAK